LINPSHNERRWDVPAGFNGAISVSEAWLRHGLPTMIQGREHLRYGITAMLVGPVFDVSSHGQSRICRNLGRAGADPRQSILAEAVAGKEDVICATVDVAGPSAMSSNGLMAGIPAVAPRIVTEAPYGGT
ncbi:MAG TPA: hypothetical protein VEZ14_05015, partial [Dehalococcoidia bacterium]|nr:hypothetical protein [Dehalococcoidia bacterium]